MTNKQIFRNGSVTYYYSSIFFKGQVKKDVFDLYAYVRIVDDLVDTIPVDVKKFEYMWEQTIYAWKHDTSENRFVTNLISLAKRKQFKWQWIESFWYSMRMDLEKKIYKNFDELELYMYGSAEVIGLMMSRVLDLPQVAEDAAKLQGKAMQFLNFLRDVKEDFELGRNYLGYKQEWRYDIKKWNTFMKEELQIYFKLQKKAEEGFVFIPKQYLIPIKTAADMYFRTAVEIYRKPMIVWQYKYKPSKYRVLFQLIKNYVTV